MLDGEQQIFDGKHETFDKKAKMKFSIKKRSFLLKLWLCLCDCLLRKTPLLPRHFAPLKVSKSTL